MECPKCNAKRVFKATYFRKDFLNNGEQVFVHPRYHCIRCGHKFDTVPTGLYDTGLKNARKSLIHN